MYRLTELDSVKQFIVRIEHLKSAILYYIGARATLELVGASMVGLICLLDCTGGPNAAQTPNSHARMGDATTCETVWTTRSGPARWPLAFGPRIACPAADRGSCACGL